MAVLNQDRGRDATGFFNTQKTGNVMKKADRSTVFLREPALREWLEKSLQTSWAICGHTRGGTRGGNIDKNAHPFEYGEIVGSHNGVISQAPAKYSVDTEYAIDLLSQHEPGAYQKALGDVPGWYVLTWFDKRDESVYLLNWHGDMRLINIHGTFYYSSCGLDLAAATGYDRSYVVAHGDVTRFRWTGKKVQAKQMPKFSGGARYQPVHHDYAGNSAANLGGIGYGLGSEDDSYWKRRYQIPKGRKETDLTGWAKKFGDHWYAERYDQKFVLLTNQEAMHKKYSCYRDTWHSVNPGEKFMEQHLGKYVYDPFAKDNDDTKVETKSDIKLLGSAEDAVVLTPSQAAEQLTEAQQEQIEKEVALAAVDAEFQREKDAKFGSRYKHLTGEQRMAHDEAMVACAQEGLCT